MSASPAAPFGYKGRSSSSDKEPQTSSSKEPLSEAPDTPLRRVSTAGSESSGIISPTNSEVFYPSEHLPGIMPSSAFGTTSNKDENSEAISAPSKVNASDSYVETSSSSVVSSDVTSRISSQYTSPKIKLESSKVGSSGVSFYLFPGEKSEELQNSSVDSDKEPVRSLAGATIGAEPVSYHTEVAEGEASANKEKVQELPSLQQNTDMALQADKTVNQLNASDTWDVENNHKMSPDDISSNCCNSSGNTEANLNEERDSSINLNNIQGQGNPFNEAVEEQIHAAKVLQSRSEPEIFIYPTIADGQTNQQEGHSKASLLGSEINKSGGGIMPETLEPDYVDIAAVQARSYSPGLTESSGIIATIPSVDRSIIDSVKDQTIDSEHVGEGLTQSKLLPADTSDSIIDLSENRTNIIAVTSVPSTSLSSNVSVSPDGPQNLEDNKLNAPDLISSIPYLPLLTPYRSEESTTDKIESPYEEDVFFDEDKSGDCGLVEEHQETVINGLEEEYQENVLNGLEADKASDIHVTPR